MNHNNILSQQVYNYYCANCNYTCKYKNNFNKHLQTLKHLSSLSNESINNNDNKNSIYKFFCDCGKKYKHRQNLFTHKKKCVLINKLDNPEIIDNNIEKEKNGNIESDICNNKLIIENSIDKDCDYKILIYKLIKENSDFKDLIIKQQQQIGDLISKTGTSNINTTNNINQKFNIQIFLNDQCKDAINMREFIKSIEISIEQLDVTKNKGIVSGLSNAILENMSKLSLYKRPLHCTDVKRETLYIKNDDGWKKDEDKSHIKQAIKDLSNKQYKTLLNWTKENPDFKDNDEKQNYFAKVLSAMGKESKNIDEKIIKNICSNYYLRENNNNVK